jgi:hypothetical protein
VMALSPNPTTCEPVAFKKTFEQLAKQINPVRYASASGNCTRSPQCATSPGGNFVTTGKYACDGYCDGQGGCNYPDNCKCATFCGSSPKCSTMSYPGTGDPPGAASYSAGNPNYLDTCENCILKDNPANICYKPGTACNGVYANTIISPNNNNVACNNACVRTDCGKYAYNQATGLCYAPNSCIAQGVGACAVNSQCCLTAGNPTTSCLVPGQCI